MVRLAISTVIPYILLMKARGIRLRKVVDRSKSSSVLECLKKELAGRSVDDLMKGLRGPVELRRVRRKTKRP
jgi:hypothetical protein